ncbi:hypothetical protein KFK14_19635 [Sphingobium phenoxybenzoativorans]|uniref:Twin-arginine translocation pathway signal protein n=1 Tax=Sphingobium phenoxybenzoativorans TaxID=1592790 RepID=A0A975Q0S5_9SPHN|nr:hypothetical protein [Sphingobium phenoxybenzoativorans]QUT05185.1 hypothetical protein KFK14_19635 [Sphingobium phenoxybenzoativorans]
MATSSIGRSIAPANPTLPSISRRGLVAALAVVPVAACAVPAVAATVDSSAWDAAMAHYLKCKEVADTFGREVHDPVHAQVNAIRPTYNFTHQAGVGLPCRYFIPASDFEQFDLEDHAHDPHAFIRPKIEALKEEHARFEALKAELDADAINDRYDALVDAECEACYELLQMPAPHAAAMLWKAEYLFGAEAKTGDSTPSYSGDYVEPFLNDVRRFAGGAA